MDCKFGLDIFFDLLLAWLTLFPLSLPFPQISHLPATVKSSVEHKFKKQAYDTIRTPAMQGKNAGTLEKRLTFTPLCGNVSNCLHL
jgi:hypothetical protein